MDSRRDSTDRRALKDIQNSPCRSPVRRSFGGMSSPPAAHKPAFSPRRLGFNASPRRASLQRSSPAKAVPRRSMVRPVVYESEEDGIMVREGDVLDDRYEVTRKMGEGTFCVALRCLDTLKNRPVCVKLAKGEEGSQEIHDELRMLVFLKSDKAFDSDKHRIINVLRCFRYGDFSNSYVASELMQSDLLAVMARARKEQRAFKRAELMAVTEQALSALEYFASRGVVHCDIKPENILVEQWRPEVKVKVADLGSACMVDEAYVRPGDDVGTCNYRPPEVLLRDSFSPRFDVYSLACVITEMATGDILYPGQSDLEVLSSVFQGGCGDIPKVLVDHGAEHFDMSPPELVAHVQDGASTSLRKLQAPYYDEWATDAFLHDLLESMLHPDAAARVDATGAKRSRWMRLSTEPARVLREIELEQARARSSTQRPAPRKRTHEESDTAEGCTTASSRGGDDGGGCSGGGCSGGDVDGDACSGGEVVSLRCSSSSSSAGCGSFDELVEATAGMSLAARRRNAVRRCQGGGGVEISR